MQREYRCDANSGGCGRLWWYRDATPRAHDCATCGVSLIATGRYTDASVRGELSERAAKHQTYATLHPYTVHLDRQSLTTILNSGTILDTLEKSA